MSGSTGEARPIVAYQGEPGAFSEAAIVELWGDAVTPLPCATFDDAARAVADGRAQLALLPVENSIAGRVAASIAAIDGARLVAVGETALAIRLCVLALPGATLETLRAVESHPVALRQCGAWLAAHPWITPREGLDTAGAAWAVAAAGDAARGAIASARAGALAGLTVLVEGIEDRTGNVTRFTIVATQPTALPSRALAAGRASTNLQE